MFHIIGSVQHAYKFDGAGPWGRDASGIDSLGLVFGEKLGPGQVASGGGRNLATLLLEPKKGTAQVILIA